MFLMSDSLILFLFIYGSGVQIPSAKSPGPPNFVGWAKYLWVLKFELASYHTSGA
jgi:hypothetical protein